MKLFITLISLSIGSQLFAYDLTHKFGIGAGAGIPIPVFGNQFNEVANAEMGVSVYGRYHFNASTGFDLGVSQEEFKDTSMNFKNIDLLGFWRMAGAADYTPILGLGVGVTSIKDYAPKDAKLSLYARGGAEYGITPSLAIDALLDYQYVSKMMGDMPGGAAHVLIPKVTLTWYFGTASEKSEMQKEMPKEEAKAVMAEEKKEQIVADLKDEYKNEETTTDVVSTTAAAPEAPTPKDIMEMNIEFDSNKSEINDSYQEDLEKLSDQLRINPEIKAVINGYADNTGTRELNERLAKDRAEAVREKLIELGVEEDRLEIRAYGAERPIMTNETEEGRQKNRRAYISVVPYP